mgnify:CR=1 FL=1
MINGTPYTDFSHSASCRLTSASTNFAVDRIHQRFSSAISKATANTRVTIPVKTDASTPNTQLIPGVTGETPSTLAKETIDDQLGSIDYLPTHAYQIPQQANVGSESLFLIDSSVTAPLRTNSTKKNSYHRDNKSVSCPFYVMYLTNLAMQQQQHTHNNISVNKHEKNTSPMGMSSTTRKVPVNSRTSTAHHKNQALRRQVNSPISINTYSTIEDDDRMTVSTVNPNNKRSSDNVPTVENDNTNMLQDILRTSSWNHIKV